MNKEPELMIEDCPPLPGEEPGPDDVVIPFPRKRINKEENDMEDKMTIDQVLAVTIDILEGIDVPMKKLETIGIPIQRAIGNLRLCIQAMEESRAKQQAEANPELSVVPCDEPDVSECEETEIVPAE